MVRRNFRGRVCAVSFLPWGRLMAVRYVVEVRELFSEYFAPWWSTGIFGGDDSTAQVLEYLRLTRPEQVFRRRVCGSSDELPPG